MSLKDVEKFLEKFWFLFWRDDSLKGWIFSIIFLFIFIKFIFFPALSLLTGTSLPLAIVESCSMYHEGNLLSSFDKWKNSNSEKYSEFQLTDEDFENFTLKKGFNKGDILFIVGTKPEKIHIGDVIIFNAGTNNPIIHRVINVENIDGKISFSTIGDNNEGQLSIEKNISPDRIVGKASLRLMPYIGWIKLVFFEFQRSPSERGFCE